MKVENQRLIEVCEYLMYQKKEQSLASISNAVFGHKNYFTALKRQDTNPSQMVINYLVDKHNVNSDYIWRGEGEMLKDSEQQGIPIYGLQANIDTGVITPHDPEPIQATAEVIPIVPSEVAGEMGVDIRKFVEKNADELDSIDPTKLLKNPDLAEQVAGTSMLPTFAPGDVVFVKFLPDKAKIIDGKTYYFDLRTLPTMIRKVKFEGGDRLRLIAKNPAFADIAINRCDILNIGRVIGMFRQSFGDQYDEIEEVRRKKDHQIDKLIDQNAKALESIGNLVDVIKNRG